MDNAVQTLFLPLVSGQIKQSAQAQLVFFGAQVHPYLQDLVCEKIILQQSFKPYVSVLSAHGYKVQSFIDDELGGADIVLALLPKNIVEAKAMIAKALNILSTGGTLLIAADNKSGGARLKKFMESFGVDEVQSLSKNKARAAWAIKGEVDQDAIDHALNDAQPQRPAHGFVSQPGVFGWDKIDQGSQILAQNLPRDLGKIGSDFGCGYGYLSHIVLSQNTVIETFYCIDADSRALDLAQKNLDDFDCVEYVWADLTQTPQALKGLDFIVMNPPFHQGRKTNITIGQSFIKTAQGALKKGGALWMVANVHLPYERILQTQFSNVNNVFEAQGFKIFKAIK